MPYQRSQNIELRLDVILLLIRDGRYSTPKLADEIGVSVWCGIRRVQAKV